MAMNKKYLWLLLSIFFVAGCESLEDTYSDYAGDGAIRYLGSCTEVSVVPGWQRLIVTWNNGIDPVIDKVKVSWKINDIQRDTLLERNLDSCSLPTTANGTYEVTVRNVDQKGNSSLATTLFVRPYSYEHEAVSSFTRLISKQYFVGDNLLLFFSGWVDNISKAQLDYTDENGNPQFFPLTQDVVDQKFTKLPGKIDLDKPVVLKREGRVSGCPDLITFESDTLSHEKLYSSEFKTWIKAKYNLPEFDAAYVEELTELEIDYSISSLVDILNLPKLQKLILGKNRYLYSPPTNPNFLKFAEAASTLLEMQESFFALKAMHSANKNFTVERYNQHYFRDNDLDVDMQSWVQSKPNPSAPARQFIDPSKWSITCSGVDPLYLTNLSNVFDGDANTPWLPADSDIARIYEIQVDMQTLQTIEGARIIQMNTNWPTTMYNDLFPPSLKIKVSKDGLTWEDATCISDPTLGNTLGEITDIKFAKQQEIRYVKFILYDQPNLERYAIVLAEIQLWAPEP